MYGIHIMDGYAPIRQSYLSDLSDNLQSDKYTDMLAYPYLLEFSLKHNYLQSVLNFPQPRKYEFNLSDKGTSLPRALINSRFSKYLLGIKHESCTGIFKSLKLLQLKIHLSRQEDLGNHFYDLQSKSSRLVSCI